MRELNTCRNSNSQRRRRGRMTPTGKGGLLFCVALALSGGKVAHSAGLRQHEGRSAGPHDHNHHHHHGHADHGHRHLQMGDVHLPIGNVQRCGSPHPSEEDQEKDAAKMDVQRARRAARRKKKKSEDGDGRSLQEEEEGEIVVPLFVHAFDPPNWRNIRRATDSEIERQVAVINLAFSGSFFFDYQETIRYDQGSEPYTAQVSPSNYAPRGGQSPTNVLNLLVRDLSRLEDDGVPTPLLGYAFFPELATNPNDDNVHVHLGSLPGRTEYAGRYDSGDTSVHEIGHWLGLYHTFKGGCESSTGDYVDDTPAKAFPHESSCQFWSANHSNATDSCPGSPGVDLLNNYMDYSFDNCMDSFTPGQRERMVLQWEAYRERPESPSPGPPPTLAPVTVTPPTLAPVTVTPPTLAPVTVTPPTQAPVVFESTPPPTPSGPPTVGGGGPSFTQCAVIEQETRDLCSVCSNACVSTSCFVDLGCPIRGGLGCALGGIPACRNCEWGEASAIVCHECPVEEALRAVGCPVFGSPSPPSPTPTPTPTPTRSPTPPPTQQAAPQPTPNPTQGGQGGGSQVEEGSGDEGDACLTRCVEANPGEPCYLAVEACSRGAAGCNVLGMQDCRFCGFGSWPDCPSSGSPTPSSTTPTGSTGPNGPTPTSTPSSPVLAVQEGEEGTEGPDSCAALCLEMNPSEPCFRDEGCGGPNSVGCGAFGLPNCRFCGFVDGGGFRFMDCP